MVSNCVCSTVGSLPKPHMQYSHAISSFLLNTKPSPLLHQRKLLLIIVEIQTKKDNFDNLFVCILGNWLIRRWSKLTDGASSCVKDMVNIQKLPGFAPGQSIGTLTLTPIKT